MAVFGLVIGFILGTLYMSRTYTKYFSKNPTEIVFKGRTYVFTDKPNTDDNSAD